MWVQDKSAEGSFCKFEGILLLESGGVMIDD